MAKILVNIEYWDTKEEDQNYEFEFPQPPGTASTMWLVSDGGVRWHLGIAPAKKEGE